MKTDLGEIFLCASLDARHEPRRFSAQQMPSLLILPILSRLQLRIKPHAPHPPHHLLWEDEPNILRNHISRHKIKRVLPIRTLTVLQRARISRLPLLEYRGLHLHPHNPRPLIHRKAIARRLSPRPRQPQPQLHRPYRKHQLHPLPALLDPGARDPSSQRATRLSPGFAFIQPVIFLNLSALLARHVLPPASIIGRVFRAGFCHNSNRSCSRRR